MKLGVPFLQFPLQFDAATLAAEIQAIDESAWRPHPAGYAGNDALLLVTVDGDPASDSTAGPMRATEHLLRCPYLMQVLGAIGGTWGRSRLMRLSGRAEVTPHVDINYYWRERAPSHGRRRYSPARRAGDGSDGRLGRHAGPRDGAHDVRRGRRVAFARGRSR